MIALLLGATADRLLQAGRSALDLGSSIRVVVRGDSMLPALSDQDRVLVSRVAYRFNSPQRGDIVLLGKSVAGVEVVKRIIAMPGDLRPDESGKHPAPEAQADRLSADEYYVLGDNRAVSRDSRTFGPVKRSEVSGRVWYRYAPSSQAGRIGKDNG